MEYGDNLVLYRENLKDGGITGDEILNEQTEVYHANKVNSSFAYAAEIDNDNQVEHSKVHLGELRFDTEPTDGSESETPNTTLHVEVDWLNGENPNNVSGTSVLTQARLNMRLYGFNIVYHRDDNITRSELEEIMIVDTRFPLCNPIEVTACHSHITPDSFNARELSAVKNNYHDNEEYMHLFWTTNYNDTEGPRYRPHDVFVPAGVAGLTGHTGSPAQVTALEETGRVPYGVVMLDDAHSPNDATQRKKTLMHEMGHVLSIGWLDDKGTITLTFPTEDGVETVQIDRTVECYSGTKCVKGPRGIGGGEDPTPEFVEIPSETDKWSTMSTIDRIETFQNDRLAYSIEELITADLEDIPSKSD